MDVQNQGNVVRIDYRLDDREIKVKFLALTIGVSLLQKHSTPLTLLYIVYQGLSCMQVKWLGCAVSIHHHLNAEVKNVFMFDDVRTFMNGVN
jgi:hypothetical protein